MKQFDLEQNNGGSGGHNYVFFVCYINPHFTIICVNEEMPQRSPLRRLKTKLVSFFKGCGKDISD